MARHEDGDALFLRQFAEEVAYLDNPRRVQAECRLVKDEKLGIVQQRLGKP